MKLVKSLALVIGLMCVAYFVGATAYQWTLDTDHNGTPEFRIDTDGNTEIAGTLAVTGASTLTGATTVNDILTVSSDSAIGSIKFSGRFASLPTSGYSAITICYLNGNGTTSPGFYYSTATVTTASCWVPMN